MIDWFYKKLQLYRKIQSNYIWMFFIDLIVVKNVYYLFVCLLACHNLPNCFAWRLQAFLIQLHLDYFLINWLFYQLYRCNCIDNMSIL